MYRDQRISLVIPCLNEEAGVTAVLSVTPSFVDEVVVVDNGSTDRTAEVARELGATVVDEPRRGYGRALKSGIAQVQTGIVVTMDGDGTYPCESIAAMLDMLFDEGYDFISGSRYVATREFSVGKSKRFVGNLLLTLFFWLLYGKRLRDSQSGMWVFKKQIIPGLELKSDGMPFSEEIKIEAFSANGLKAGEYPIPYNHAARIGESKLRLWRDGMKNLIYLFQKKADIRGRASSEKH